MIRSNVYLTNIPHQRIKAYSEAEQRPAAEVLRDVIDDGLALRQRATPDLRAVRGAAGRLPKPLSMAEMRRIAYEGRFTSSDHD